MIIRRGVVVISWSCPGWIGLGHLLGWPSVFGHFVFDRVRCSLFWFCLAVFFVFAVMAWAGCFLVFWVIYGYI